MGARSLYPADDLAGRERRDDLQDDMEMGFYPTHAMEIDPAQLLAVSGYELMQFGFHGLRDHPPASLTMPIHMQVDFVK